jgi:23S rRNA (pseudouridine1915-N3)-methyltransferase
MRLTILAAGHMKHSPEKELLLRYQNRLSMPIDIKEIKQEGPELEAHNFQKLLRPDTYIIALDERGKSLTTLEFSNLLTNKVMPFYKQCTFIIGGADGIFETIRAKSHTIINFGKMTWPHMLVRAMLVEQIYRVQQIQNNHPYHRE